MEKQFSFRKYEHEVLPSFRQKINMAESTEDVKKFFSHTTKRLFENIFEGKMRFENEDVILMPDQDPPYMLSGRLRSSEDIMTLWKDSDLRHVIQGLAESASRRCRHLEKHPEKTDAKIRI